MWHGLWWLRTSTHRLLQGRMHRLYECVVLKLVASLLVRVRYLNLDPTSPRRYPITHRLLHVAAHARLTS